MSGHQFNIDHDDKLLLKGKQTSASYSESNGGICLLDHEHTYSIPQFDFESRHINMMCSDYKTRSSNFSDPFEEIHLHQCFYSINIWTKQQ